MRRYLLRIDSKVQVSDTTMLNEDLMLATKITFFLASSLNPSIPRSFNLNSFLVQLVDDFNCIEAMLHSFFDCENRGVHTKAAIVQQFTEPLQ
jgi:hypothetical protein